MLTIVEELDLHLTCLIGANRHTVFISTTSLIVLLRADHGDLPIIRDVNNIGKNKAQKLIIIVSWLSMKTHLELWKWFCYLISGYRCILLGQHKHMPSFFAICKLCIEPPQDLFTLRKLIISVCKTIAGSGSKQALKSRLMSEISSVVFTTVFSDLA